MATDDRKLSFKEKLFGLAVALFFMIPGLAIYGFFYHSVELICSRAGDTCTIVRTASLGETRISFGLSSITGAEKIVYEKPLGRSSSAPAWHIALHTTEGDRHLTNYDTGIGEKKMDKNVKAIIDFIAGNAAHTLVVRQDDRIIALASLPFFFCQFLVF